MPCLLISRTISKIFSTKIGASPIDGSSRSSSLGRAISARPMAHICCSPPDIVPAFCARRSCRRGKSSKTRSMSALKFSLSRALEGAHLEVLRHRHAREQPPPLRALRDAALDDRVRRRVGDVAALEADRALPRPVEAVDGAQGRRLAGAVRADQGHDLAGADAQRDALERVDGAVVDVRRPPPRGRRRRRVTGVRAHAAAPLPR